MKIIYVWGDLTDTSAINSSSSHEEALRALQKAVAILFSPYHSTVIGPGLAREAIRMAQELRCSPVIFFFQN